MAELSQQDKIRIARHFVMSSPPGELQEVLADVRALVDDDALLNAQLPEILRAHNLEHMTPAVLAGKPTLVSKFGEADAASSTFVDPRSGQTFSVNHMTSLRAPMAASEASGEPLAADSLRDSIQAGLNEYLSDQFDSEASAAVVYSPSSAGEPYIVCVSASKSNASNFWSGRWRSMWRVEASSGSSSIRISGNVRVHVHYYEDGNVQLSSSRDFTETAEAASEALLGATVAKTVGKLDAKFQQHLEDVCATMSDTTFKGLRRKLPITGQKFDFSSFAHKLASEMRHH